MIRTAYVAGPMTNRANFNFPAFDAVSAAGRALGIDVSNPHEHDQETYPGIDDAEATKIGDVVGIAAEVGFSFAAAMKWDLSEVARCDAIIMLPEWETSTGAKAERFVAELTGSIILLAHPPVAPLDGDLWAIEPDPVQKRLAGPTIVEGAA